MELIAKVARVHTVQTYIPLYRLRPTEGDIRGRVAINKDRRGRRGQTMKQYERRRESYRRLLLSYPVRRKCVMEGKVGISRMQSVEEEGLVTGSDDRVCRQMNDRQRHFDVEICLGRRTRR